MNLLLISGSTRHGSTNSAALRTAAAFPPEGVRATVYEALAELPAFNPDHDTPPLPEPARQLRTLIGAADAVVLCTPEYAGTLPGSLKNLLDWTVGGSEMYGKPVAWIDVASPGRGSGARATLATVLGYVGATVLDAACVSITVPRQSVGPGGLVSDPEVRAALTAALETVAQEIRRR